MTVPKPFNLGLNKRVEERHHYQEEVDQRQREAEARERVEREEREKREIKEYRKTLNFKVCRLPVTMPHASYYSGPSLIRNSLIRTLANPNRHITDIHCNFGVY